MSSLRPLLDPASVAIVGLSADPYKHGRRVYENLRRLGYRGPVMGVHPQAQVPGVEIYRSLGDLPAPPEVVVCATPAATVLAVALAAGEIGARGLVVFAGGFAEAGEEGRALQERLAAVCREAGMLLLGPNSGGVIRPGMGLALSFLTCLDRPAEEIRSGPVGLVTQSGGTGSYLHNLAAERGSGLAVSVSTGNEAGVDLGDALSALVEAEEVEVIALVLETVRRGDAFLQALKLAQEAGKPVVACLLGRSRQGSEMMVTHTGAMALPQRVLEGVLDANAVTVTATPGELFEVSEVMARSRRPTGERAMVVTHSGGMAILLADLAAGRGVELPPPSAELGKRLRPLLQLGAAGNPLDLGGIIGGPHRFAEVVETVGRSGEYDLLLAVSTAFPVAHTRTRVEGLLALDLDLPLVHLWMAGDQATEGAGLLTAAQAPVAYEPRAAMAALAGLARHSRPPELRPVPLEVAPVEGVLSEHQSKLLLSQWGIPVVEGALASGEEEAVAASISLGYPVVAKLAAPGLAHKARRGGVEVGLWDEASVRAAYRRLLATGEGLALEGVRVERYRPGLEVIVGGVRHPVFGPMLLVGLGGAQAELVDTAMMALAPLGPGGAGRLLRRLGADSWPGSPDLDQLAEILVLVGRLIAGPYLAEIEINPLAWTGTTWEALDAVVRGHRRNPGSR